MTEQEEQPEEIEQRSEEAGGEAGAPTTRASGAVGGGLDWLGTRINMSSVRVSEFASLIQRLVVGSGRLVQGLGRRLEALGKRVEKESEPVSEKVEAWLNSRLQSMRHDVEERKRKRDHNPDGKKSAKGAETDWADFGCGK